MQADAGVEAVSVEEIRPGVGNKEHDIVQDLIGRLIPGLVYTQRHT
jgi:hypothetical protein